MIGELTSSQKRISLGLVISLVAAILVQTFYISYKAHAQELPIADERYMFPFLPKSFKGPYMIATEKYEGFATLEGDTGTIRSLIVKATAETANAAAYTWINVSFPKENSTNCLQVYDQNNTWIHFSVCDPSEWDKRAWFIFAVALGAGAYLGGIWGIAAVGLFGLFAGILIE